MGSRRRGREAALQMLYQMDVSGVSAEQAVHSYWAYLCSSKEGEDFGSRLVRGWSEVRDDIDERIRAVSTHWRIERMAWVDRNILRLATFELVGLPDVPRRVTLNEAVELAKRFGSEGSPGFVNGVLDRIASDLGKD
ncbi:MAG: transcription antitermination factor NusB [Sandaracinaceae bacterium]